MARGDPAKILYATARSYYYDTSRSLEGKLQAVIQKLKFASRFAKGDHVAIKMHFMWWMSLSELVQSLS